MFDEEKRKQELESIRKETSEMSREEGARKRPAVTMIAVIIIVWLVLFLFDLVNGRGVAATSAIAVAAFAGLCWGTYRESRERKIGYYAIVAGAATAVLMVLHFMGA